MSPKTVLITGCSDNGIGSALGLVLQRRGYHVFASARTPSKMTWIQGLSNITPITLDITKSADIKAAVDTITQTTGGTLDYLINNAAHNHFMPALDENLDEVRSLMEVNFIGPLAVTQAFAPMVIKVRKSLPQRSKISDVI
jgi:NAD(P)-dependent dehydrogenase (short-subunit alcohol dehydrogenase family)